MKTSNVKRKYHHHDKWEDAKAGMYNNPKSLRKEADAIVMYFQDSEKVREYMIKVVTEWKYSCEQNLTNPAMNKIAYLGQASVCMAFGFSRESTMFAWNFLDEATQNKANQIAQDIINYWEEQYAEKIL